MFQVDDGGVLQANVMQRGLGGEDTASKPVAVSNFTEGQPRLSPDGRWVAFVSDERGSPQVFVQPFPGPGERVQVSIAGGQEPVWSRDGRKIFYRDGRHMVAASTVTTAGFAVTDRTELFADAYAFTDAPHANYDVASDGRFLMVKPTREAKLAVVYGWQAEVAALLRKDDER